MPLTYDFCVRVDTGAEGIESQIISEASYCQVGDTAVEFKDRNNKTVYAVQLERFVDATRINVDSNEAECDSGSTSTNKLRREHGISVATDASVIYNAQ